MTASAVSLCSRALSGSCPAVLSNKTHQRHPAISPSRDDPALAEIGMPVILTCERPIASCPRLPDSYGPLAAQRPDDDFYLCRDFLRLSGALLAGVCLGSGLAVLRLEEPGLMLKDDAPM